MLTVRVIPCLDVRDGRVVKGVQFSGLRDAGCPVELAREYQKQGADELVLLDVSATPEGRSNHAETVRKVRKELSIPLTVGGGVRTTEDAARLLDAGADKVGVNTAAVADASLLGRLSSQFGAQCTILALDAARKADSTWEVVTHSGKTRPNLDAIEWAKEAASRGAGEILLTSWDRDGTKKGYDLDLLRTASAATSVPVIASGGANSPTHLLEAINAGADAVLAASIFHEATYKVEDIKKYLRENNIEVRL